jgi:hypothetical protein
LARARLTDLIATQDFRIMTMASVKTQALGLDRGLITACSEKEQSLHSKDLGHK